MNKILYHSGSFYLLQNWPEYKEMEARDVDIEKTLIEQSKANKIKIANQEELPIIQDPLGNGLIWDVANDTSFIESGDTFDLPKELSVKFNIHHEEGCAIGDLYSSEHVTCDCNPSTVAILSKSSSPEIPDSSEKQQKMQTLIKRLKSSIEFIKKNGEDMESASWGYEEGILLSGSDAELILQSLPSVNHPTVAGTSTEPYKTNDSEVPNSSEKPDFFSIAIDILKVKRGAYSMAVKDMLVELGEEIWSVYVAPRDKTISDLRERVKELEEGRVSVKAELILELHSKREWVNRIPYALPEKTRAGEDFLFIDKHGHVFESGADFEAAEKMDSYPCRVYKTKSVKESI